MAREIRRVMDVQHRFQQALFRKKGVVGVGVGFRNVRGQMTDDLSLIALVEEKKPMEAIEADDLVPREVGGMETDVLEVGILRALQATTPRTGFRPVIPPGVSMGHPNITAGTFGALVFDLVTGEPLVLSNNHVIANSNEASIGDVILQPGPTDGGQTPGDAVATLHRYIKIAFEGDPAPDPILIGELPTPTPPIDPPDDPIFPDDPLNPPNDPTPTPQPPVDPVPNPPPPHDPTPPPRPVPDPPPTSSCDIVDTIVRFGNSIARLNGSEKRLAATSLEGEVAASSASPATAVSAPTLETVTALSASAQQATIVNNQIDGALAKPNDPNMFSNEIRHIGVISGTVPATLGMRVRKSGRTTDYTEGMITLMNATVNVSYVTSQGTRTARFTGQLMATAMSQGGDSGSLVVDANTQNAVGLLFAGSPQATIFTPIDMVLSGLKVRF